MLDIEKPFLIYCDAARIRMYAYARWSRGSICFIAVEEA
jgi:hypothetical protein